MLALVWVGALETSYCSTYKLEIRFNHFNGLTACRPRFVLIFTRIFYIMEFRAIFIYNAERHLFLLLFYFLLLKSTYKS